MTRTLLGFSSLALLVGAAPDPRIKTLERSVVCPEKLPDDNSRMAAARDFVQRYGAIYPHSRMGERMAARERLLKRKGCRAEMLHHSFPET